MTLHRQSKQTLILLCPQPHCFGLFKRAVVHELQSVEKRKADKLTPKLAKATEKAQKEALMAGFDIPRKIENCLPALA